MEGTLLGDSVACRTHMAPSEAILDDGAEVLVEGAAEVNMIGDWVVSTTVVGIGEAAAVVETGADVTEVHGKDISSDDP